MSLLKNNGEINVATTIITFIICVLIALVVAIFHHYYQQSVTLENKSVEIENFFRETDNFPKGAKSLLNERSDLAYVKLLDKNGVLEESFGNDLVGGVKDFTLNGPENKSIIIGIKKGDAQFGGAVLLWSLLIGAVLSFILIILMFLQGPRSTKALKKLESAMERVSQGDLTARLEVDSTSDEDLDIMNSYQSFNRMVDSLNKRFKAAEKNPYELNAEFDEGTTQPDEDDKSYELFERAHSLEGESEIESNEVDEEPEARIDPDYDLEEDSDGKPQVDTYEEESEDYTVKVKEEGKSPDITQSTDEDLAEKGDEFALFKPKIILPEDNKNTKERKVTVFVAKISDFEDLSARLDSSDLNSFLTEYRKSASSIINNYGGVIEALLQDEIVAIFNAPDMQDKPELRAVCAAVEVLHELATMTKKRKEDGKEVISGKIGISVKSIPFYSETGIPNSVKEVIGDAREICDNAGLWKVFVNSDLYEDVGEYVEVKEFYLSGETVYSILGVEQGVI